MLAAIAAKIGTWLLGTGLASLGKIATDLYSKKLDATNNTERVIAELAGKELAVNAKEAELDNRLLVAEQGNWFTRWVRPMWAAPYVVWTWKVIVWDMCLGYGSTIEIKGFAATLGVTIAASYFGGRSLETIARIVQTRQGVTGK